MKYQSILRQRPVNICEARHFLIAKIIIMYFSKIWLEIISFWGNSIEINHFRSDLHNYAQRSKSDVYYVLFFHANSWSKIFFSHFFQTNFLKNILPAPPDINWLLPYTRLICLNYLSWYDECIHWHTFVCKIPIILVWIGMDFSRILLCFKWCHLLV